MASAVSFCFGFLFMTDQLLSSRIKLDRAAKHFNDLIVELEAFGALNPYRILPDEDSEPAIKIYRVQMMDTVPAHWSAIVGDLIHNLKSALDALATSLVTRGAHLRGEVASKTAIQETYFPIRGKQAGLSDDKAIAFFRRAGPEVEKVIRHLQPYRGGKGDPLWRLNQLNIIDKHRRIIAAYGDLSGCLLYTSDAADE